MREWQRAMQWVVVLGFALGVGCSDDAATDRGDSPQSASKPASASTPSTERVDTSGVESIPAAVEETRTQADMIEAGRGVYNANCIACHNMDPTKDGALGPAVAGSSLALLEARVLRAEYPEGYTPKRDTRVMVALRHLEPKIKDLKAYLDSLQ